MGPEGLVARSPRASQHVPALRVNQWLPEWDKVKFDKKNRRSKPEPDFYVFALSASALRNLSGIFRRSTEARRAGKLDLGIQRRHDVARSKEIHDFVRYGYPWSDLSDTKRKSGEFDDLRKPGWLPTAIVVNILSSDDVRLGSKVDSRDLIHVKTGDSGQAVIELPSGALGARWRPKGLPPIEVIDGQHRLWAFDPEADGESLQLPVVAFHGLDLSWQAYLFWTINIKPKRINPSLAFDLYPLLRTEDWLTRFDGHSIYRETRAQELTQALWAHPSSPWKERINMLGEPGIGGVTQAAWIRSLMASFVKAWEGGGRKKIGGLFGAPLANSDEALPWSRAQQAAFLIKLWRYLAEAIEKSRDEWAKALRPESEDTELDPAFAGPHTLLNTDQGVRGVLQVSNDLSYVGASDLALGDWALEPSAVPTDEVAVDRALSSLKRQPADRFLRQLSAGLANFDWRASSADGLTETQRTLKLTFRGSGGYRELRRQLLKTLMKERGNVGSWASIVFDRLGFDK